MPEGQSMHEREVGKPLADQVQEVFERRATQGERKFIWDTYNKKFEQLLQNLPKEKQANIAVKIQKIMTTVRGFVGEYGSRFADFVRKAFLWPMIRSAEDFPKDKYYQMELARAKAWGEFAKDTTKTATRERTAFRDHFLSTAVSHAQVGAATLGTLGVIGGAALEGAKAGAILGIQGAAAGAVIGGALGGAYSWGLHIKDKMMGPPVVFYDLFAPNMKGSVGQKLMENIQLPMSPVGGLTRVMA